MKYEKAMDEKKIDEIHKMAQIALGKQIDKDCTKWAIEEGFFDNFEALYDAGYRKIPKNAVVLTREEYEILLSNADNAFQDGLNESRELYKQEVDNLVKEKVRKIFTKLEKRKRRGFILDGFFDEYTLSLEDLNYIESYCFEKGYSQAIADMKDLLKNTLAWR
jgi:hypothetical protein